MNIYLEEVYGLLTDIMGKEWKIQAEVEGELESDDESCDVDGIELSKIIVCLNDGNDDWKEVAKMNDIEKAFTKESVSKYYDHIESELIEEYAHKTSPF